MSAEQQSSFSSFISINPYTDEYVSGVSSFLTKATAPNYSKEQFVSSYLNTKAYISNQILINKNIPKEDILDAINIKIYDELGLDQAIEYEVQYIETFNNLDENNKQFQVFLVDPLEINDIFQTSIEKIKYIDTITPFPLLIKSLYSKEIIQDNGVHCFIYFEQDDASITIYNGTEFIYTKSLKYSLIEMYEKFCELYGEKIEYNDFITFLSTQNLKFTQSDFKKFILKLYHEIFSNINEIITYAKKAFELKKIDHIYIGSEINIVSKLYEISEVELSVPSSDFEFDYGFESNDTYISQVHALMHVTATLTDEKKYLCNFSNFHRPPKFTQRESGKFLMLLAASFFIAFSYPTTYWILTYIQELQYELLKTSYSEVHAQKTTREANIKSKEAEKTKALALLKEEKDSYISKKNTLIKIHDVKVNYPMKATLITTLVSDLNKYAVNIEQIQYNQETEKKKFVLNLISSQDKKITQLLEYLTKKYDNKFKFALDDILFNEDKKLYFSELKVYIL